jgi:pyruvate/2-oxoglutarate/acetoin dehydrogenase E1 component
MIVLTTDHKVFLIGEGGNGQLGIAKTLLEEWTEVSIDLLAEKTIAGVAAGSKSSFLLAQRPD